MTAQAAIITGDNVSAPAARERPGADTTEVPVMQRQRTTPEQRFWAKVNKDGPVPGHRPDLGPCWLWRGARWDHGYGSFYAGAERTRRVHRFAYELLIGPIPEGLEPDHLCMVKHCVNPAHLEPVTHEENARRSRIAQHGRSLKLLCKHGHPLSGDNSYVDGRGKRRCRACQRRYRQEHLRRRAS